MIKPSKNLINFIDSFSSKSEFCKKYDIDQASLSKYLNCEVTCSAKFIGSVLSKTGMDFEKAFEVNNEDE